MQKIDCQFCNKKALKPFVILKTRHFVLIKDKFPITKGHCLLVSKDHIRSESDLSPTVLQEYTKASLRAYKYIETNFGKAPLVFINPPHQQSVEHLHKHFVPGVFGIMGVDKALRKFLANNKRINL